ncbi:MAG: ABC transporter ATP-binding protein [Flavobacteriales bacterium]|nr:ABC transporter ATP-binding protein [Flavobacteriales bacterium]
MARDTVIRVEDVHKRYRLGIIGSSLLTDEVSAVWARMRRRPDPRLLVEKAHIGQRRGQYFWALQGVSFEVKRGDILGIVGRNGAGKSTILKLLSRISLPTRGRISLKGKLSSLLEVGTGFHPELTGRENIFLNGAILGMRKAEIVRKLDEIIAFSGIEHHLDTPIKRYSSGMKVRLGFSVAAHLDPDILIVDEVLAVGDAEFQRKCLGSMRKVADSGRTILLVSHNVNAVHNLCNSAIWLDQGELRMSGGTHEVVRSYLEKYAVETHAQEWEAEHAPGTDELRLLSVKATSLAPDGELLTSHALRIEFELLNLGIIDDDLDITLRVSTHNEVLAFISSMARELDSVVWEPGRSKVTCIIPPHLLNEGGYRFTAHFRRNGRRIFQVNDAIVLEMRHEGEEDMPYVRRPGVVHPKLRWER